MGFQAWNNLFDGPYPLPEYLKPKPGVFIVWCVIGGEWDILDAGSSDNVKTSLLLKDPFESYPGMEPAMLFFSASYLGDPKIRQALLERIKGPSFVPADYKAKINKLGKQDDDKMFGAAKMKSRRFRSLKKLAATPIVPKRILQGLRKRIHLPEREKAPGKSLKEGGNGNMLWGDRASGRGRRFMIDVLKFLDLAVDLETQISKLYGTIAERSEDPPIAAKLNTLANEEINHANVLRRGKQYYDELPDFFPGFTMDADDARKGLEEVKEYQASLGDGRILFLDGLTKLLDFEKRFERIHLTASVAIREPSLRKLFVNLMGADQSHILVLKGLIESFGENG